MSKKLDTILAEVEKLIKSAYQAGRDDTLDEVIRLAGRTSSGNVRIRERSNPKSSGTTEAGYRPGTTIAKVHEYIKENPGCRGRDIIEAIQKDDPTVADKTVRTSLNRLKHKWGGHIKSREGKWYPVDPVA